MKNDLRAHSLRHHKRTERKSPDITAVPSIKMFQNFFNQRVVKYSWLSIGLVRRRIIFPSKTALGYLLNLIQLNKQIMDNPTLSSAKLEEIKSRF